MQADQSSEQTCIFLLDSLTRYSCKSSDIVYKTWSNFIIIVQLKQIGVLKIPNVQQQMKEISNNSRSMLINLHKKRLKELEIRSSFRNKEIIKEKNEEQLTQTCDSIPYSSISNKPYKERKNKLEQVYQISQLLQVACFAKSYIPGGLKSRVTDLKLDDQNGIGNIKLKAERTNRGCDSNQKGLRIISQPREKIEERLARYKREKDLRNKSRLQQLAIAQKIVYGKSIIDSRGTKICQQSIDFDENAGQNLRILERKSVKSTQYRRFSENKLKTQKISKALANLQADLVYSQFQDKQSKLQKIQKEELTVQKENSTQFPRMLSQNTDHHDQADQPQSLEKIEEYSYIELIDQQLKIL